MKIRHNGPLKDVDLGLLYNGQEENSGHYSPLFRTDGQFLESTELFFSDNYYDEEIDKEEREFRGEGVSPSGDNILISRARLIELVKKEKQLDEINAVLRRGGGASVGGRSSARMEARIRSDTEEEMEVGEIPDVHQGGTYCELCKIDVVTTKRLKKHVIKFHEGKFRHLCKECNKGYMSKDGFRLHKKSHQSGYTNCPEENCKGGWSSKKAEKRHYKVFHSREIQEHRCEFCPQHKPFRTVWDLKQQLERCPANTSSSKREPVPCDIC